MMEHARSRLPVLAGLAREVISRRKARSFVVTHVLGTSVPYLEIINRIFPIEAVLAIPYSMERRAVDEVRAAGIEVIAPATIPDAHRAAGEVLQRILCRSSVPVVAQEVSRAWLNTYVSRFACASAMTGEPLPA